MSLMIYLLIRREASNTNIYRVSAIEYICKNKLNLLGGFMTLSISVYEQINHMTVDTIVT